jgi:hypothetical protein
MRAKNRCLVCFGPSVDLNTLTLRDVSAYAETGKCITHLRFFGEKTFGAV